MHIRTAIQNLGLNQSESDIYLASLKMGESTMADISNKVSLPRSSCYDGIKKLISLGLINVLKMGSKKLYRAENPEKLLVIIREREAALREIMPQLKSAYNILGVKPSLCFYEGKEGLKMIFNNIIEVQKPLYAITSIDDTFEALEDSFAEFIEKRKSKYLRVRLLTNKTAISAELRQKDNSELRQTKFLQSNSKLTTASFIYGNRVAVISNRAKNPFGIIIDDPDIAQTHRTLFDIIWNISK